MKVNWLMLVSMLLAVSGLLAVRYGQDSLANLLFILLIGTAAIRIWLWRLRIAMHVSPVIVDAKADK